MNNSKIPFSKNDRKNKKGGGCMIYIRDGLPYRTRPDLQDNNIETCVLEVNRPMCENLSIWSIYCAPDSPLPNLIDNLNLKITLIPQVAELVLLGDFNVDVLAKRTTPAYYPKQRLTLFASTNNLTQLIDSATRINEVSSTAIDLFFVNNKHHIVSSGVLPVYQRLLSYLLCCEIWSDKNVLGEQFSIHPTNILKKHF